MVNDCDYQVSRRTGRLYQENTLVLHTYIYLFLYQSLSVFQFLLIRKPLIIRIENIFISITIFALRMYILFVLIRLNPFFLTSSTRQVLCLFSLLLTDRKCSRVNNCQFIKTIFLFNKFFFIYWFFFSIRIYFLIHSQDTFFYTWKVTDKINITSG